MAGSRGEGRRWAGRGSRPSRCVGYGAWHVSRGRVGTGWAWRVQSPGMECARGRPGGAVAQEVKGAGVGGWAKVVIRSGQWLARAGKSRGLARIGCGSTSHPGRPWPYRASSIRRTGGKGPGRQGPSRPVVRLGAERQAEAGRGEAGLGESTSMVRWRWWHGVGMPVARCGVVATRAGVELGWVVVYPEGPGVQPIEARSRR